MQTLSSRQQCGAVLALLFLVCSFVPQGYMPNLAALSQGVFKLQICTMDGMKQILVDNQLHKIDPHKNTPSDRKTSDICPFAGIGMAGIILGGNLLWLVILAFQIIINSLQRLRISLPVIYTIATPRGPPVFI